MTMMEFLLEAALAEAHRTLDQDHPFVAINEHFDRLADALAESAEALAGLARLVQGPALNASRSRR
jgi:uncharacterized protein (DUF1778 family)